MLRVIGDANCGEVAFHLNPLVLFGVAPVFRVSHLKSPLRLFHAQIVSQRLWSWRAGRQFFGVPAFSNAFARSGCSASTSIMDWRPTSSPKCIAAACDSIITCGSTEIIFLPSGVR